MPRVTNVLEDIDFAERLRERLGKQSTDFYRDDYAWVLVWVMENFEPEDIFDDAKLDEWAVENGYI